MAENKQLTRNQLYNMVWEKTMTSLAKQFAISVNKLNKICRDHQIPKPLPGYWAKLEHGKKVAQKSLPVNPELDAKPIVITSSELSKPKPKVRRTVYVKSPIPISKRLNNARLHYLVAKTLNTGLEIGGISDVYGLHKPKETCLDILVTPKTIRRSLLLADTIIKAVEARGHKLQIAIGEKKIRPSSNRTHKAEECFFNVKGEKIRFAIGEKLNRIERSKKEDDSDRYSYYKWKYIPSGLLRVKVLEARYGQDTWMDNKKRSVEEQIPLIVKGILTAADKLKKSRIEREIEKRHRAEQKRLAELRELNAEHEQQRIGDLIAQVDCWHKVVAIRNYLNAVEQISSKNGHSQDPDMEHWLKWANNYADSLDPLMMFDSQE